MHRSLFMIPAAILMAVTLSACGQANGQTQNKTLNVTLADEPATADPNKSTDTNSGSVISQTMEGLYTYSKSNKIIPGVATKIVKPTNHGKTYTFTLKKNAKWANGQQVTAQDFVTSLQRMANPKTKAQYASLLSAFKNYDAVQHGKMAPSKLGIKALSKTKLQIQLTKAVPYFNSLVASDYYPLNTATVKKYGAQYGTSAAKTMSDGPYKLVGWTGSNSSWHYVKNTHYWNAQNVKINNVKVSVTKDETTAANLFKSGKIQETTVSGQYVRSNGNEKQLKTHLLGRMSLLVFNSKQAKTSSENLRQAVSYVIDRNQLVNHVLGDGSKAATSAIPYGDQKNPQTGEDMTKEVGNLLPHDVTKAKAYWQKYLKETGKSKVTLNILTDDSDDDKHVGTYIQSVMEKNFKGLTVNITALPHAQHVARDFAEKFDINLIGWSTSWLDADDYLELAAKGNSVNFTNWNDTQYNQLLQSANAQTGIARYNGLIAADKYLMSVKGYVPVYQPSEAKLVSDKVGGLTYSLLNEAHYQYAYWK
ncbi:ABC transporter substrate-binding protein [Levilactobacillus zymae]|uniref:ABC transporter substrate-binding protein n=1 Tax=Levilactobacillus zymae TaxID=267363 RepID=A0ABQ0WXX6_9LACO|nr:peptide ABC transporter substrate-binding protein [Levilactobacillus zymae]QFR61844.1 peptide ABC transporter substrate-binding protein [Levilactobacillus zymae]GEO72463.1 ABC transporter substrate-binding protein [Levilactobacillus zymae]